MTYFNVLRRPQSTLQFAAQAVKFDALEADWSDFSPMFYTLPPDYSSPLNLPVGSPSVGNTTAFFDWFNTSLPASTPSTILERYLCQIPVRKPWGSLLVSILVADLVFLQVFWKVLNWAVALGLERKHPGAGYCLGREKKLRDGDYEMVHIASQAG